MAGGARGPSGLVKAIPLPIRLHPRDLSAAAMWGFTAAVGALWMVQFFKPFDWLKEKLAAKPEEQNAQE